MPDFPGMGHPAFASAGQALTWMSAESCCSMARCLIPGFAGEVSAGEWRKALWPRVCTRAHGPDAAAVADRAARPVGDGPARMCSLRSGGHRTLTAFGGDSAPVLPAGRRPMCVYY